MIVREFGGAMIMMASGNDRDGGAARASPNRMGLAACVVALALGFAQLAGPFSVALAEEMLAGQRVHFEICGRVRHTSVVDGDTISLDGVNLRLTSFDTPEPDGQICGGRREVELAHQASERLLELLNSNSFTVETFGLDATRKRTLATS